MKSSRHTDDAIRLETIRVHARWQVIQRSVCSEHANGIRTALYALRHDDTTHRRPTVRQRIGAALRGLGVL